MRSSQPHEYGRVSVEEEIFLNQIAQGVIGIDAARTWFPELSLLLREDVLRFLVEMVIQSRAVESDVSNAIEESGLRPTFTPCVMLSRSPLKGQLQKILGLPEDEHLKLFVLLIHLFRIADRRRQDTRCDYPCEQHWWHWDLGNPTVLNGLLVQGECFFELTLLFMFSPGFETLLDRIENVHRDSRPFVKKKQ